VLWDSRPRQPHPALTDEVITAHLVADDLAALGGTLDIVATLGDRSWKVA
jgi:hypothetical protein